MPPARYLRSSLSLALSRFGMHAGNSVGRISVEAWGSGVRVRLCAPSMRLGFFDILVLSCGCLVPAVVCVAFRLL